MISRVIADVLAHAVIIVFPARFIDLNFKSVAGYTKYSHKTLRQSSISIEQLVREDLATTLASALDRAAIQGSGTGSVPTSIVNTAGINTDTYSSAPTFADIVDMEGAILNDNVDLALSVAYVTTPMLTSGLKSTEKASGSGQFIWDSTASGEGRMNGYRAFATNNCPAGSVILGKWSDLLIGFWGAVEIIDRSLYRL